MDNQRLRTRLKEIGDLVSEGLEQPVMVSSKKETPETNVTPEPEMYELLG